MEKNISSFESVWQEQYHRLETDIELHRIGFVLTKQCMCKSNDCIHYQKEKRRLFENRINNLLAKGILINATTDARIMRSKLEC